MKKTVSVLIALVLMLGVFSGCSNGDSSNNQGNTSDNTPESFLIITASDELPLVQYTADLYKQKYGVDVEIVSQSYDQTYTKIVASVMGGTSVDIISDDSIWTAEFADEGILVPLDDMMTPEVKEDVLSAFIDSTTWDGKTWAIPFQAQGKWLFYNKAMLQQAGYTDPPKTFSELFAMGKDMVDKNIAKYGVAWAGVQAEGMLCDWTYLLHASGSSWKNSDDKWGFNDSNGVKALEMYIDSYKNGIADPASITYDDRNVLNPFMAGDVPFVFNWAFAYPLANDKTQSKIAGDVGIALIPSNSEGITSASVTGGGAFGIASSSKNKEWAWKYLEMMVSKDVQQHSLEAASSMPILKSMYEDQNVMKDYPWMQEMYPQFQYAVSRPVLIKYSEWSNMMQINLHKALTGQVTAKDALDEMVNQSNSNFER